MTDVVVGRDSELASARDFVVGISDGAAALVLEGVAGVGKTTLWSAAVAEAEDGGLRVLRALPAESETALSFAGVGDLLEPVLEEALAGLPAGQRNALSRALVLEEAEGPPPDAHAVGVGLLNALRALAATQPLVVAVDDVQWLDSASSSALCYAGRRLRDERIGVLLSRRTPLETSLTAELRRSLPPGRCHEIEVGPLGMAALHGVIQEHLGAVLPRPLLAEVHAASGGNPFYALEIVRTLQRTGDSVEAGQPLPVPESLHDLVHDRLRALPSESRDYLLAAAAHAHPRTTVVEAASEVGREAGLVPALQAGIVELDGDRIRFTHPLLAAGAYETGDPARRNEIHSRLAELLDDPEARAWQLAASVREPDASVAAVLEEAAGHARTRGAPRPAALLLDRARALTPAEDSGAALRRGVDAAFLHFESGDAPRAEAQLQELIAPLAPGHDRATALWILARIRTYEAPGEAAELFLQVVEEAGGDPHLLAVAHEGVASSLYYAAERLEEAERHAEAALQLARELGDKALEGDVLISKFGAQALLGSDARITAREAETLQLEAADRRILDQPVLAVGEYWILADAHAQARETFLALLQLADERGDESARPYLLSLLSRAELDMGSLRDALEHARAGRAIADQAGQTLFAGYNRALEALALAWLGDEESARSRAREALVAARSRYEELVAASALGQVELAVGASREAVASLDPALEIARHEGIAEPGALRFVVDKVEALIELGRSDEAQELLAWYEGNARRLERSSALANCARCRGLLAAQAVDLDGAFSAYEEAFEWHGKVELPLDRGRTLLALGAAQRRAKRRREARATLEEALALFELAGAKLWAERTRAELKRISGRAAIPGALTPAEERVAALVAEGKTNKEVAAALFLSDRTVEGHLARIFGKLGIRHRTEVAAALQTQGVVASNTGDSSVSAGPASP